MRLLAVACALLACGCSTVAPYQRGHLARADMAFEPTAGIAKAMEKTFPAKEAASGSASVGGGGCGCN
jgi:hypothetical protein